MNEPTHISNIVATVKLREGLAMTRPAFFASGLVALMIVSVWGLASDAQAAPFLQSPWTGDGDVGITAIDSYNQAEAFTHAINLNGGMIYVNGLGFAGVGTGSSTAGGYTSNTASATGRSSNVTGNSKSLADNFVYNPANQEFVLNGLTAGKTYKATFYAYGWEASGRTADWTASDGGGPTGFDQDAYGNNNGQKMEYTYTPAGSTFKFDIDQTGGGTWHHSGFTNQIVGETNPFTVTVNNNLDGLVDGSKTYTHAVDLGPGTPSGTTVNGITFVGRNTSGDGGQGAGYTFALAGAGSSLSGQTTSVAGAIGDMMDDFYYGGGSPTLTLDGLTPGESYTLTLFNERWGGVGDRMLSLSATSTTANLMHDQNANPLGDRTGSAVQYNYIASGTSETIEIRPFSGGNTSHWYAFSNNINPLPSNATPEPSTAILTVLGFVGLMGTRRRRRR